MTENAPDRTRTVAAWEVAPEVDDQHGPIVVAAQLADGDTMPTVALHLPQIGNDPATVMRFDAVLAETIGQHLITAADAAREASA